MTPCGASWSTPGCDQRQLAHCLTQNVTLREWLPQMNRHRSFASQLHGRRYRQDGVARTCGDDQGSIPAGIQQVQRQDSQFFPRGSGHAGPEAQGPRSSSRASSETQ